MSKLLRIARWVTGLGDKGARAEGSELVMPSTKYLSAGKWDAYLTAGGRACPLCGGEGVTQVSGVDTIGLPGLVHYHGACSLCHAQYRVRLEIADLEFVNTGEWALETAEDEDREPTGN